MQDFFDDGLLYLREHVFGLSQEEIIQNAVYDIRKSIRELEREKSKEHEKELALIKTLQKEAPRARSSAALKPIALSIARTRRGIARIDKMIFSLNGMSQNLLQTKVSATMNSVMQKITMALAQTNSMLDPRAASAAVHNYERQTNLLEYSQDMIDGAHEDEEEEDNADAMLAELAEEVDLNLNFELPNVKANKTKHPTEDDILLDELNARFKAL